VKVEKPIRVMVPGATVVRAFYSEFSRVPRAPSGQRFSADLVDVLRTAVYLVVSVPAYVLASMAFAAAIYLRLAGALLLK
jgi:hypothetical protein